MATRRTHTLSTRQAEDLRRIRSIVLGDGGTGGTAAPNARGQADRAMIGKWAQISDYDDDGTGVERTNYAVDVLESYGSTSILSSGLPARNSFEKDNTSSTRAGYTIVSSSPQCGDIIGIERLPVGLRVQIVDVWYESGAARLIFSVRNDPRFQEV